MSETVPDEFEIGLYPIAGWGLVLLGATFLPLGILGSLGMLARPPYPVFDPVAIIVASLGICLGLYLIRNPGCRLRFTRTHLELVRHSRKIPWTDIESAELILTNRRDPNMQQAAPVLVLRLTPAGQSAVGGLVRDSGLAGVLDDDEHVGLRLTFLRVGPHLADDDGLLHEIQTRSSVSRGELPPPAPGPVFDESGIPDSDALLVERDGPTNRRVYVHQCGTATVVTDGSLRGLCNPWSYTSGTMCMQCGVAMLEDVRWEDTGEQVSAFRKRVFRHTPLAVKLFHFLGLPIAAAVAVFFFFPFDANFDASSKLYGSVGMGFLFGYLLLYLTPISAIIPFLAGMRHSRYL